MMDRVGGGVLMKNVGVRKWKIEVRQSLEYSNNGVGLGKYTLVDVC